MATSLGHHMPALYLRSYGAVIRAMASLLYSIDSNRDIWYMAKSHVTITLGTVTLPSHLPDFP
jgi:hypothetical protein